MGFSIINTLNQIALRLERSRGYARATATELVLQFGKPQELTRLTAEAYNRNPHYLDDNNRDLRTWEESIVREFFPKAPAKVLVGACGGGREMLALERLGYRVAGFDPGAALVDLARKQASAELLLALEVSTYEDLIAGSSAIIGHAPFDAVILGWGSLSHLSESSTRLALLRQARRLCPSGPILLSWVHDAPSEVELAVRKRLSALGLATRDACEGYSIVGGFSRSYSHQDIFDLAAQSGNRVLRYDEGDYPHALFAPLGA